MVEDGEQTGAARDLMLTTADETLGSGEARSRHAGAHGLTAPARHPLARFLIVGALGFASDSATFGLGHALGAPDWLARAVSLVLATLVTWQLNRRFTFAASGRPARSEALRYALVTLLAQGFSYASFLALRSSHPGLGALPTLVVTAGCAAFLSFSGQRFFTFRPLTSPP